MSKKSKSPSPFDRRPKPPVYSIEVCPKCDLKTKRAFQVGDQVYKQSVECSRCKTPTMIMMIYVEPLKQG